MATSKLRLCQNSCIKTSLSVALCARVCVCVTLRVSEVRIAGLIVMWCLFDTRVCTGRSVHDNDDDMCCVADDCSCSCCCCINCDLRFLPTSSLQITVCHL